MTRPDLSRLSCLMREVERDQERLAALKDAAQRVTPHLTGMPGGGGDGDKVGRLAGEIADLERVITAKLALIQAERAAVCGYISALPDQELREILYLRYVSELPWRQMAAETGKSAYWCWEKHKKFMEDAE